MNSLRLILLLSTLSALSAAFAQNCELKFTPLLPRNSDFNKACSADSTTISPCFHHVSGSLHSANITFGPPFSEKDESILAGPIIKDGFLTDFTFDTRMEYYINYTAEGIGLRYQPGGSEDSCFHLSWAASSGRAVDWNFRAALANGGEKLFDMNEAYAGFKQVCGHVDLWLEKK
ncbi:hypothetical protein NDA10_007746 [Ustilago hordei]|uniref:Mig1 protein n=1 Tax=Ustilago hordei TaxID=120017 RepID=I2FVH2_USTHO|nr:uncharacterized protein UHO2_04447 [Ustilago hordei]KAJ1042392.1 hypothetical protein NDA10_007746 [Ustilago hordei]KAJ1577984.1 hypothetical protein NDA12_000799 [Ustilago hordei]KAJ1592375.1 hypothetical protein NDA15_001093 [Ustilago hordei]UTT89938.1 hypothetical protein NDA17_005665 [Ustilago hordei]CCF50915.1 uncharacterized protein UHOR_06803 [Ustilago hordei]